MQEITRQYVEEVRKFKENLCRMSTVSVQTLDAESLEMIQNYLKIIDINNDMYMESARIMDEMNAKLDRLLQKKD